MNALFLLAAAVAAFAFGYRFYAKLLALDIFRLDKNYSTPAQSRADGRDYVPTHRHLLFGHHVAAVTGAAVFAAPIVALGWGWAPVFLWITVGTAVAAGTFGLGAFWLSLRHAGGLGASAHQLLGPYARAALLALMLPVIVIVAAVAVGLTAALLADFPHAVLPAVAIVVVAYALGSYLHGRTESELIPAIAVAFAATLLLAWLLGGIRIGFDGALAISVGGTALISVDAVIVWVVLLLVYAFHAARLPVWKLMRPRGLLASLLLLILLLVFYGALIATYPAVDAPEFHARNAGTRALPWLFIVVGAGALAGWQWFIVDGVTGREMRQETDARYIGYGAALMQGLVAISALLLAATAFDTPEAWRAYYAEEPSVADFPRAAAFYVSEFARLATVFGVDVALARNLAATVLAALSLAVLEAGLRMLKHFFIELSPPPPASVGRRDGERTRILWAVLAIGVVALHDGRGLGGLTAWPVLGLGSLWLAAVGFGLMTLALRLRQQPVLLVAMFGGGVAVIALWATAAQLWAWWHDGVWLGAIFAAVLLLLVGTLAGAIVRTARRPAPSFPVESASKLDT